MRLRASAGLLIFLFAFGMYALSINGVWATDHATSFLQLDWSIWNNHTFVLGSVAGGFKPNSADDFLYNGKYYSALAPGTAILALPFAGLGFMLEGHFDVFNDVMILSELFIALINAVAAYLVYLVSRLFFSRRVSILLAFVYAFSTISWPFATFFFQSDVSACFDLIAAYFALRASKGGGGQVKDSFISGAAVAVALTIDYINAVFLLIIGAYLALSLKDRAKPFVKPIIVFVFMSLLGLVLILSYNYVNFGSAFRTTEQLYLHSSNVFAEFSYPLYLGVYLNLFSPYRGLFIYSIFLVLGVFGFYDALGGRPWRNEALFLLACFLGVFLPYSMWYDPGGGDSFGPRFLVAAIPFLLIPSGFVLEKAKKGVRVASYVLLSAGVVTNGIGALTSAISPATDFSLSPLLDWNIPLFLSGQLDVWWVRDVGAYWTVPSLFLIILAISVPVMVDVALSEGAPAPVGDVTKS